MNKLIGIVRSLKMKNIYESLSSQAFVNLIALLAFVLTL
jgi:hypothetical protein